MQQISCFFHNIFVTQKLMRNPIAASFRIDSGFINVNIVCSFCVEPLVAVLPSTRIDSIISDDNEIAHVNTNIVMSSFKH